MSREPDGSGRLQDQGESSAEGRGLFGTFRFYSGLGAGALLITFFLQNLQEVRVNFLWYEGQVRLIIALAIAAVLGAITTLVVGYFRRRARAAALRRQAQATRR